jgi:hypothetical protein
MPFEILEDPDGKPVTAKATEDGVALVASVGAEGEALATEETLARLASTVTEAPLVLGDAPGVVVKIASAPTLVVQPAPGFSASATPSAGAAASVVRVVDLPPPVPAGESGEGLPVVVLGTATVTGGVVAEQGRASETERWGVTDTATEAAVVAVEAELQDKARDTSVDEVESKLDTLNTDKATATGQAAGNASLALVVPDADATRIAVESIDTKTLTPLGTAPLKPVRAVAPNVATQLGSLATPRGFSLDNVDASNYLYWGDDNTLTIANGYRIDPGYGYEFPLPNTNLIWVIAATTADYQIGGTL